jgi:two-component system chemotaxis sensor kinase CheA
MDVVKRNVDALNGAVSVSSEKGRGSTVRIKLPLTLAVLDGLLLRVGSQTFVLPLVSIIESIRPISGQLSVVAGCGEVVSLRGEPLPLLRLHKLFGVPTNVIDPTRGLLVIVENHGRRLAFLVDEIIGQQQVVVKSLEANFRKVEGLAGATILGDGHAALILDVAGLALLAQASVWVGV